jgi:hypothetical protein
MAQPDDYLRGWVDQLVAMQDCMAQINTDTDPALRKFCAQKPSDLLLSAQTQTALGICLNDASGLAIPGNAVANSATFRAFLDTCYRPLMDAIVGLMWQQATDAGGNYGNMSLAQFGAIKISVAFPDAAAIDNLCLRLEAASTPTGGAGPLFPQNDPQFRLALSKANATVLQAAQSMPTQPAAVLQAP